MYVSADKDIDIRDDRALQLEVDDAKERAACQQKQRSISFSLGVTFDSNSLQASDLVTLMVQAPGDRLVSLRLDGKLEGDFSLVTHALSQSTHLQNFHLWMGFRTTNSTADMPSLGAALALLPQLEDIKIICLNPQLRGPLLWDLVTPVVRRPNSVLKKIYVSNFDAPAANDDEGNDAVVAFFKACADIDTLKDLTIEPSYTTGFNSRIVEALTPLLSRLEGLSTRVGDDVSLLNLVKALKGNQTLKRLDIDRDGTSASTYEAEIEAIYDLLYDNFSLKKLDVGSWPTADQSSGKMKVMLEGITFFLALNKQGRMKLLFPTKTQKKGSYSRRRTNESPMDAIYDTLKRQTVFNIYNALRQNPSMWLPQTAKALPPSETKGNGDSNDRKGRKEKRRFDRITKPRKRAATGLGSTKPYTRAFGSTSAPPVRTIPSWSTRPQAAVISTSASAGRSNFADAEGLQAGALQGTQLLQFSYETFAKSQAMFAAAIGEGAPDPQELHSTNILSLCVKQVYTALVHQAFMEPSQSKTLMSTAERYGVVRLTKDHWVVSKYTDESGKEWFRACFVESALPLKHRSIEGLPKWFEKARPWTTEDAVACVASKFRQFAAKEAIIYEGGKEKKGKAILFESIEFAMRMEAAFCLERNFGLVNQHWYELKFSNMMSQLLERVPPTDELLNNPAESIEIFS